MEGWAAPAGAAPVVSAIVGTIAMARPAVTAAPIPSRRRRGDLTGAPHRR